MKIGLGIGLINKSTSGGAAFPVNVVAPVISGTTIVGSTLSCTTGTWTGSPNTFIYGYQWYRNDILIIGANSNTYVTVAADSAAVITCVVTANNCGIALPSNTVAPAISGTAVVGQTLTTSNGTWNGTPLTYDYRWFRGTTQIGTNSNTYTLLQADAGNTSNITCVVTANNLAGSANATSNQIAQILTVRTNSFLTASAISDTTIRGALNTLDVGLISNSLDAKMKALYPFVGGTASTHRWNFMDARDLDAAYRLSFNGTSTASSNGWVPNGTNAYANTFFQPSLGWTNTNSVSFGVYTRNNTAIAAIMGSSANASTVPDASFLYTNVSGNLLYAATTTGTLSSISSIGATSGLFVVSRTASNLTTVYRNGTSIGSTVKASTNRATIPFWLGAANFNGYVEYGIGQWAFAFMSDGLNATDVTNLNNIVTAFQTTLGRQV